MDFLTGLIFGSMLRASSSALLLAPFAIAVFILFGWGMYESIIWFDASAAAYVPTAWYEWPWHWPGAHFSLIAFDYLDQHISTAFSLTETIGRPSPVSEFPLIRWLAAIPFKFMRATIAMIINIFVASVPLILLGKIFDVIGWIRRLRTNQPGGHEA